MERIRVEVFKMKFLQRVLMGDDADSSPVTAALSKIPSQRCPLSARHVSALLSCGGCFVAPGVGSPGLTCCDTFELARRGPQRGAIAHMATTMERSDRILVVDDDAEIRTLLTRYLEKNGLRATAVGDGKAMWRAMADGAYDLVVLDVMLPGDDGLTLCRQLRAKSEIPILMLTARGDETDRIVGLEMGADDYLPKPFNPRELLARIKVILRRTRSLPPNLRPVGETRLRFAGWVLDTARRQLRSPAGEDTPISSVEYKLLHIFVTHPNRVLSRDQLLDLTQGREADPLNRSIDVQVSRLRQRLGDDPRSPALIKTVRGEGYVLSAAVEAAD
jgi:two-component system OmpR family response regulator